MALPRTLVELFAHGDPAPEDAALVLARDFCPDLDPERTLASLDSLAETLRGRLGHAQDVRSQAAVLGTWFHDELGFRGNETDYYDPRNSYLHEVLARRTGIPITLAVVLQALGRRAGLDVQGVGFPGHFLVRLGGPLGVLLDPFFGARLLDREALVTLARRALGPEGVLRPEHLEPVSTRALATRMLMNLKNLHERRQDHRAALVVCDRLVDLTGLPEPRRDRGLHALALGALAAAEADLQAYLDARGPAAPDARSVRAALAQARRGGRALQ
ncbi:MAG: tetratricopeptide repeat protein [Deltaproteobacteria bacterium]|nr:tetratricopeptide repeat protein [Deltaproteobacteria bacterium]